MPATRTTHRSANGNTVYADRDEEGLFKDLQSYKRAQAQAAKRRAKAEQKKKR